MQRSEASHFEDMGIGCLGEAFRALNIGSGYGGNYPPLTWILTV